MNTSIYLQLTSLNKNHNNHFLKRYVKLVSFYKQRNFKKKKFLHHEHHILPESFGGEDSKENLVFITIREHFILHWILYKAFPKSSMTTAFFAMCSGFRHYYGNKVTSKVFEKLQIENAERNSENNLKRVAEGKHNFSGGEIQRESNRKRLEDKTHHFLDKDKARERAKKRIVEGKNIFSGGEINRKQLENGTHTSQIKIECEHCKKTYSKVNYINWHGSRCKLNPLYKDDKPKIECEHCNRFFSKDKFTRYHGDNCKLKPI